MRGPTGFPVAAALAAALLAASGEAGPPPLLERPAPPFKLRSVDGSTLALGDLRGKVVVLHFGASW